MPALDEGHFHHEAFFYVDAEEFLAGTVPFVREGLEAEEAILVATPRRSLELLKSALGGEAKGVEFVQMEEMGRNPARIISTWHDFVDAQLTDWRGIRGIGEPVWAERTPAELDECEIHESLLNLAFDGAPAWSLMCPYNTTALDDRVLSRAEHNHPALSRHGDLRRSHPYVDPAGSRTALKGELDPPAATPVELTFYAEQLGDVRRFVAAQGRQEALDSPRLEGLVVAANEVATNSLRYGGGSGEIRIWREGDALACEIRDRGRIEQPLVGRKRPLPDQAGGRGLWLANQLCDLVQIRSGESGSVIRLWMSLS